MRPELPYLAAGAIAIGGGVAREKAFPKEGMKAVIGTVALTLVASATAETVAAPLVHALGLLLLMAAIMATVTALNAQKAKNHG